MNFSLLLEFFKPVKFANKATVLGVIHFFASVAGFLYLFSLILHYFAWEPIPNTLYRMGIIIPIWLVTNYMYKVEQNI